VFIQALNILKYQTLLKYKYYCFTFVLFMGVI